MVGVGGRINDDHMGHKRKKAGCGEDKTRPKTHEKYTALGEIGGGKIELVKQIYSGALAGLAT